MFNISPDLIWPITLIFTAIVAYFTLETTPIYSILVLLSMYIILYKIATPIPVAPPAPDQSKWAERVDGSMTLGDIVSKLGVMTMSDLH